MNKKLQILLGITASVWLVIGLAIIAGLIIILNLPDILGLSNHTAFVAPFLVNTTVEYHCVERELGSERAGIIYEYGEAGEDSLKIEHCFN